jgi:starch-binding outer membrane protein, SusD/RagB family
MNDLEYRARRAAGRTAVAIGTLLLAACSVKQDLLAPQNPGIISPSAINSPGAADAVRIAAFGNLKSVTAGGETMQLLGGLMTDEWKSSDTFSQRNETDQRSVETNNSVTTGSYQSLQQARGHARDAINALLAYEPTPVSNIGQMFFAIGFEELTLAENYCNGIPVSYTVNGNPIYTAPLTDAQVYTLASTHFDSALALTTATDANTVSLNQAILISKARTLVQQGNFAAAAALVPVTAVPTSYQYLLDFDLTTSDNGFYQLNTNRMGYTLGDSVDATGIVANSIPFVSLNDPRVPVINKHALGEDGATPLYLQNIYQRDDPVPLVSGIDARLIEAEARLNAPDINGMMTILNTLRTTPQTIGLYKVPVMAALPTPATQAAAIALFFREKAFWQFGRGYRLPDLRRMIRLYGFTQDKIFPTGTFFKSGVYGTDVNFPVFDTELTNPNFHGCLDRNA